MAAALSWLTATRSTNRLPLIQPDRPGGGGQKGRDGIHEPCLYTPTEVLLLLRPRVPLFVDPDHAVTVLGKPHQCGPVSVVRSGVRQDVGTHVDKLGAFLRVYLKFKDHFLKHLCLRVLELVLGTE